MKKDIKIIALDLDGTLLDSQKRLSEANRAALAAAAEKGILVVPTTGRFFGMMPAAIRDLPFVRYAITINGAQVYDRETDSAIVREEIPLDMALDLMTLLDRHDVVYDCYRANWGWMTASLQAKAEAYATDAHYLKMIREFRNPVPDLKAHLRATAAEGDVVGPGAGLDSPVIEETEEEDYGEEEDDEYSGEPNPSGKVKSIKKNHSGNLVKPEGGAEERTPD